MKIRRKENKNTPKRGRRGPPKTCGYNRVHFFAGDSLKLLPKLNRLLKEAGVRQKITKSFAYREGVATWLKEQVRIAKKALKGELHAKPRKDVYM